MSTIEEILSEEGAYVEVKNAFAFSMSAVYMVLSAQDANGENEASALLRVDLTHDDAPYEILHRYDFGTLDYLALSETLHVMLVMGGYVHVLDSGEVSRTLYADMDYVPHLSRMDGSTTAIFGDNGLFYRFRNRTHELVQSGTVETLQAAHFPSADFGYVGGDYGVLLRWDGRGFQPVDLGMSAFIKALHVRHDGVVLIGCDDGIGLVVQDQEIVEIEDHSADFKAVTVFKGTEYWGDDDFGVYSRSGSRLIPRFETGYAFNLNSTEDVLTVNSAYDVYLFNGTDWIRVEVTTRPGRLVERVPLDFEPQ